MNRRMYYSAAKIFPKSYRKTITQYLHYAADESEADQWLGSSGVLGFLIATIFMIIPWVYQGIFSFLWTLAGIAGFFCVQMCTYLIIYYKADDRRKRVEKALPDALQLIASNLRAGMTPFQAIKLSARKEFGPLAEEISYVSSHSMGTESFTDVLRSIAHRVNSRVLERALSLFSSALVSGGHIADLLSDLANDIAETHKLNQELITSTKAYTAFMMFTIIIGTPLLLAISIHFLGIITDLQGSTGVTDIGGDVGGIIGEVAITADFMITTSIVILFITALLASVLVGVIKEGKIQDGFKTAPLLIGGVIIMFFIFRYLIGNFLGTVL